jgi:WD40 repeat protein
MRLWKTKTGDFDREIVTEHKGPITCLAIDEEKEVIYTGSTDATVVIWK